MTQKDTVQSKKSNIMFNLLEPQYLDLETLAPLRDQFLVFGYVRLPNLLSEAAFERLHEEGKELHRNAVERSFVMPGPETPRYLSTVGGRLIASKFPHWLAMYSHHEIVSLITTLTGGPIYLCQHDEEFMVANFLTRLGGTHGWHLDDPAYALILIFDCPPEGEGGSLEFVPWWRQFCNLFGAEPENNVEPLAEKARSQGLVQIQHHAPRDGYLLHARTCLHRVTELKREGLGRFAVNMADQDVPFQTYGQSATALYGKCSEAL